MDNEFDSKERVNLDKGSNPEETPAEAPKVEESTAYADPNADANANANTYYGQNTQQEQNTNYSYQNQQQQTVYQQSPKQYSNYTYSGDVNASAGGELDTTPLSMGEWLLTILIFFIPCCIGVIPYCIWAFGKSGNLHRRNFCRAALIVQGILIFISLIIFLIWGSMVFSIVSESYYY